MQVLPLDVADPDALAAWHAAHHEAHVVGQHYPTPWLLEEMRAEFLGTRAGERIEPFGGYVDGRCVVTGFVELPQMDNLTTARVDVATPPGERRRGFGTAMLERLTERAVAHGRELLDAEAHWPYDGPADGSGSPGSDFLTARGFRFSLGDVKRRLPLPVATERLEALAEQVAPYHRGYVLRAWSGPVPDDVVDAFGELIGSLVTEAPTGDKQLEPEVFDATRIRDDERLLAAAGRTKYTTVAVASDGELAAYSEVTVSSHEGGRAYQWGTLARPQHRGHRLGLATKVHNLLRVQAQEPGRTEMFTFNAEVNRHMIEVNDILGFRPVARLGEFQKRL